MVRSLAQIDAAILAAVTEQWPGRPQKLGDFVHDYDWLNRGIPSFEEVSAGLGRLVAAGYVVVRKSPRRGVTLLATDEGHRIGKEARKGARSLGDTTAAIELALLGRRWSELDLGGRKLRGFEREDWEEAVRAHERSMERWSKPWLWLSNLRRRIQKW